MEQVVNEGGVMAPKWTLFLPPVFLSGRWSWAVTEHQLDEEGADCFLIIISSIHQRRQLWRVSEGELSGRGVCARGRERRSSVESEQDGN